MKALSLFMMSLILVLGCKLSHAKCYANGPFSEGSIIGDFVCNGGSWEPRECQDDTFWKVKSQGLPCILNRAPKKGYTKVVRTENKESGYDHWICTQPKNSKASTDIGEIIKTCRALINTPIEPPLPDNRGRGREGGASDAPVEVSQ